jgi:hypothetical protein
VDCSHGRLLAVERRPAFRHPETSPPCGFCLPAAGNEKPVVENRVKTLERKWSTPIPQMQDMDELNVYLRECCVRDRDRNSSGKTETIGVRFEQDRKASASLPKYGFDTSFRRDAKVDKYQFAQFDNVSYSVPRHCAFQSVTMKVYVDRVEIVHQNAVVATHERSYQTGDQVLDPLHYLRALERRPAALDHSNVYRKWKLPAVFLQLRERLEERHGDRAGVRQFVRVLQLLAAHPMPRVQAAIEQLRGPEGADADRIIRRVERSAEREQSSVSESPSASPAAKNTTTSKPSTTTAAAKNDANHLLLKSNLKQLRLPTMKAEFEQLAREAAQSNQTFEQYLLRLTELEVSARASNTFVRRQLASRFSDN